MFSLIMHVPDTEVQMYNNFSGTRLDNLSC